MSCKLEPAIWSCDTSQRIPCFDRCQLIIGWMSNIKEVQSKPRLFGSLEYGRHVGQLRRRRRRRRAYAPTSNTASHDNHEKINSWVSFFFRMMPMGLRLAALRAPGAPLSASWHYIKQNLPGRTGHPSVLDTQPLVNRLEFSNEIQRQKISILICLCFAFHVSIEF